MAVLAVVLWRTGIRLGPTFAAIALMVLLPIAATYGNLDAFAATLSHSFSGSFALALSLLVAAILHGVFFGRGKKHLFWKEPIFVWCLFMTLCAPFLYSYGTNVEYQSRAGGAAALYLGSSVLLVFFSILIIYYCIKGYDSWQRV